MLFATTRSYSQYYKDPSDSCLAMGGMINPDSLLMDTCGYIYRNGDVLWAGFERAYGQRWFLMEFPFPVIDTNVVPIDKLSTFGTEGLNKKHQVIINGLNNISTLFGSYKLWNFIDGEQWSRNRRYVFVAFDNHVKLDSAEYYLNAIAQQEQGQSFYVKRYTFLASVTDENLNDFHLYINQLPLKINLIKNKINIYNVFGEIVYCANTTINNLNDRLYIILPIGLFFVVTNDKTYPIAVSQQ